MTKEQLIKSLIAIIGISIGYWIGYNFFMKTPTPPFQLTNDAPVYVCYYYERSHVIGSCDKFVSEEVISGGKYYQVIDGFTNDRKIVDAINRKLFYILSK